MPFSLPPLPPDLLPGDLLPLAASAATGLAVAALAWVTVHSLARPRLGRAELGTFEQERRQRLRAGNFVYRCFEPWIDRLIARSRGRKTKRLMTLERNLRIAAEPLPWAPAEYVAARQMESLLAGLAGVGLGWFLFEDPLAGVLGGLLFAFGYQQLTVNQVADRARKRLLLLKRRLPFAVDLMALMMEAGASFQESMETVVRENEGHPLAREFGEVLREISLGRTRAEALLALQQRLNDEDIAEMVFAVNTGEELGTPLTQILRTQAEQMRLKRSQWAEKAAGEAQVNIVFPGMVIMIACLLIIVAPFVLAAYYAR